MYGEGTSIVHKLPGHHLVCSLNEYRSSPPAVCYGGWSPSDFRCFAGGKQYQFMFQTLRSKGTKFSRYALKGAGGVVSDKCPWNLVVFLQRTKLERSKWKYSYDCNRQAIVTLIWFEEPLLFLLLLLLYWYSGNFWLVAQGKDTCMYHELCGRNENLCYMMSLNFSIS